MQPPALPQAAVDQIGPYRLLAPIGRGAIGVVYRAQHEDTGRVVALKTVHGLREALLASIRREIRTLSRLDHPGIVRILDHGVAGLIPWYAMELVEGTGLIERFPRADAAPRAALTTERMVDSEDALDSDVRPCRRSRPSQREINKAVVLGRERLHNVLPAGLCDRGAVRQT